MGILDKSISKAARPSIRIPQISPLRDLVLDSLRTAIVNGHYKVGDRLKEKDVARELGVSTTPVKEALRKLEHEGLVTTVPRRGACVTGSVSGSLAEACLLRAALEGVSARLAAAKGTEHEREQLGKHLAKMERLIENRAVEQIAEANTEFHRMIYEMARNPYVIHVIDVVRAPAAAIRRQSLTVFEEVVRGLEEHTLICQSIQRGQLDEAEHRMRSHILRSGTYAIGGALVSSPATDR